MIVCSIVDIYFAKHHSFLARDPFDWNQMLLFACGQHKGSVTSPNGFRAQQNDREINRIITCP